MFKLILYIFVAFIIKGVYIRYTANQIDDVHFIPIVNEDNTNYHYDANVRLIHNGSMCSGVVISRNYVLTAAHCATSFGRFMTNDDIHVKDIFDKDTNTIGHFVALDHDSDIALLSGDFHDFKNYKLNTSYVPTVNEKIVSCGFPLDGSFVCKDEVFIGSYYQQWYVKGAPLHHGDSGGAVFDKNGEVIGVNSAISQDGSILSPATSLWENFSL